MEKLRLVKPSLDYQQEILDYKEAFVQSSTHMYGGNQLGNMEQLEDWILHTKLCEHPNTCPPHRAPTSTFLCIRDRDNRMVGICNLRHSIKQDYLFRIAGHIGYSIKPSERRKGYAKEQLRLALLEAKKLGIKNVLITAADWNLASQKTILANGGILENQEYDEVEQELMNRYWIEHKKSS